VVPVKGGRQNSREWRAAKREWIGAAPPSRSPFPIRHSPFSGSRKDRLALFHESVAAFDVVVALEAFFDQLGGPGKVALAFVLHGLPDDIFDGVDGQRRVAGDGVGIVPPVSTEIRA